MRVLVYPAMMEIGGSQLNAVELAAAVRRLGHDVVMFGPNGVLVDMVRSLGLEYVLSPEEESWPSRRNITALNALVRDRSIDVVHGYEWGPIMDLAFGPHLRWNIPLVMTVMSMSVPEFLPRHGSLFVGTQDLLTEQMALRSDVALMEPPVDTGTNRPDAELSRLARDRFGFGATDMVVSVVGRLVHDLEKLEGVLEAVSVIEELANDYPVHLLVVGDGPGLPKVRQEAIHVNRSLGRKAIHVVGGLLDPRDGYRASDIVLGMGGSALKAMAFAKPLVVQGAGGFWRLLDENSLSEFLVTGWYGQRGDYPRALRPALESILSEPATRERLGRFGRRTVCQRYSLDEASHMLVHTYARATNDRPSRANSMLSLLRSSPDLAKFKFAILRQSNARWRHSTAVTDSSPLEPGSRAA